MVYLSLGSNKGDRLSFLQLEIGMIAYRVGPIQSISSVYETPAWGFESSPFLNLCLELSSSLPPEKLLDELLAIEQTLGRQRKKQKGYSARTIDIDILLYDQRISDSPTLSLPHPRMHQRRFILQPLCEMDKNLFHPILKQSIHALEIACPDTAVLKKLPLTLKRPKIARFIAIEGNIGIGKTTLAKILNRHLGGTLLLENYLDNPYLADFYNDPATYALRVERAFLHERIAHYNHFFSHPNDLPIIADFTLGKSHLFAKVNLTTTDFAHYSQEFKSLTKELPQPDCVIFLNQKPTGIMKKINLRGRSFEENISLDYLKKLNTAYSEAITKTSIPTIEYTLDGIDFVQEPKAIYPLLLRLFNA